MSLHGLVNKNWVFECQKQVSMVGTSNHTPQYIWDVITCPWPRPICWDGSAEATHDDVIKWNHFPRYWPFVRGIHRWPVNSLHKGQWRGALMLSLICAWINVWVNNRESGDLRRYRAHYDITVMVSQRGCECRIHTNTHEHEHIRK